MCQDRARRSSWSTEFRTQNVLNGVYRADMTDIDYPWEPPMAGTEAAHLTGALDRLRTTFRWKADDLDATGLQARVGASSLTLGGLLKHLAIWPAHRARRSAQGSGGRTNRRGPAGWMAASGRPLSRT